MIQKIFTLVLSLIFGGVLLAAPVYADNHEASGGAPSSAKSAVCEGLGVAGSGTGCAEDPNGPTVNSIIKTIISFLSFIVGFVAVIMLIIGGFKYITSGGDSSNISSAKNTILYAIIGLVIVALAQVIVRFVLNTV